MDGIVTKEYRDDSFLSSGGGTSKNDAAWTADLAKVGNKKIAACPDRERATLSYVVSFYIYTARRRG